MIKKYHYILFVVLISLVCCKKNNNTPSVFVESSYPLAVGNWWQYQINETNEGGGYDTITLTVMSMSNSGPYTKYNCYYSYKGTVTDSGYFLQSDTSMSFTNAFSYPNFGAFPNFHLKFPVSKGQHWPGDYPPKDTILVSAVVDSCGGYGHNFGPCYYLGESYDLPHNFKVSNMLLTPKVGLITQSIDYNSDTAGLQINQSITLLNYHVQ